MRRALLLVLMLSAVFAASLFSVEHTNELIVGEDQDYILHIINSNSDKPVFYAKVALYKGSELLAMDYTNLEGYVSFLLHPTNESQVAFSITADGYNEYVVFQNATTRSVIEPVVEPTPLNNETVSSITGFLLLNPSQRGLFFFILALVFVCLFSASYVFFENFVRQEAADEVGEESSWELTQVFEGLTTWIKGK